MNTIDWLPKFWQNFHLNYWIIELKISYILIFITLAANCGIGDVCAGATATTCSADFQCVGKWVHGFQKKKIMKIC